jgi:hypothetical protein
MTQIFLADPFAILTISIHATVITVNVGGHEDFLILQGQIVDVVGHLEDLRVGQVVLTLNIVGIFFVLVPAQVLAAVAFGFVFAVGFTVIVIVLVFVLTVVVFFLVLAIFFIVGLAVFFILVVAIFVAIILFVPVAVTIAAAAISVAIPAASTVTIATAVAAVIIIFGKGQQIVQVDTGLDGEGQLELEQQAVC